jgi:hypothetical protein
MFSTLVTVSREETSRSHPASQTAGAFGGKRRGYRCAAQHSAMEPIHTGQHHQTCREVRGTVALGCIAVPTAPGTRTTYAVKAGHETGQQQGLGLVGAVYRCSLRPWTRAGPAASSCH